MSWLYSRALVEAYWAASCTDFNALGQLKRTLTQSAFFSGGRTRAIYRLSTYGLTLSPSDQIILKQEDTSNNFAESAATLLFQPVFHVRTFHEPGRERDWKGRIPVYGQKSFGWFAKLAPQLYSWKTLQPSIEGDLIEFSGNWPKRGMMRSGMCLALTTRAHPKSVIGYGYYPTPTVLMSGESNSIAQFYARKNRQKRNFPKNSGYGADLAMFIKLQNPELTGYLNPRWVEWLMGFPIGWCSVNDLETHRFRQWQQWHFQNLLSTQT